MENAPWMTAQVLKRKCATQRPVGAADVAA